MRIPRRRSSRPHRAPPVTYTTTACRPQVHSSPGSAGRVAGRWSGTGAAPRFVVGVWPVCQSVPVMRRGDVRNPCLVDTVPGDQALCVGNRDAVVVAVLVVADLPEDAGTAGQVAEVQ